MNALPVDVAPKGAPTRPDFSHQAEISCVIPQRPTRASPTDQGARPSRTGESSRRAQDLRSPRTGYAPSPPSLPLFLTGRRIATPGFASSRNLLRSDPAMDNSKGI